MSDSVERFAHEWYYKKSFIYNIGGKYYWVGWKTFEECDEKEINRYEDFKKNIIAAKENKTPVLMNQISDFVDECSNHGNNLSDGEKNDLEIKISFINLCLEQIKDSDIDRMRSQLNEFIEASVEVTKFKIKEIRK